MPADSPVSTARRSLDWIQANVESFTPIDARGDVSHELLKALGEALLACELACRSPSLAGHAAIGLLVETAKRTWTDDLYASRALRRPSAFRLYFGLLASLARCGHPLHGEDRERLRQVLARGYADRVDELPFRQMDRDALLERLGSSPGRGRRDRKAVRSSLIGHRLPPLELTREDAYNLTHLVFYATDWGRRRGPLTAEDLDYVETCLYCLLPIWAHRRDWDLVGELLIVAAAIGARRSAPVRRTLAAFMAAQSPDGTFPRPQGDDGGFASAYHTVAVSVILGAVWEQSPRPARARRRRALFPCGTLAWRASLRRALDRCSTSFERSGPTAPDAELMAAITACLEEATADLSRLRGDRRAFAPGPAGDLEQALLAAVADYDVIGVGRGLAALADEPRLSPLGLEVVAWLVARQSLDGHFGSFAPEQRRIGALAGREVDFLREVQWPTTATVVAGIAKYVARLAPREHPPARPVF